MRWFLVPVVVAAGLIIFSDLATAKEDGDDTGQFITYLEMEGFANPPRSQPAACSGPEYDGYRQHVSEFAGGLRDRRLRTGQEIPSGEVVINYPGSVNRFDLETEFVVEWKRWRTGCARDTDEFDIRDEVLAWVRVPTQSSVVPGLLAELRAALPAPTVTWPDRSPENDWLFVNVPMDFRIQPVDIERREVTISNVAGSVSGWAQAEPDVIVMNPGEPDAAAVPCGYLDGIAPYRVEEPGRCSYTWEYSSGIDDSGTFPVSVSIVWDVTSSAPLAVNDGFSSFTEDIAVAEIQAVVTG